MELIDVEAIAENTPREVVDGWDAYQRCEPMGQQREMLGWIMWKLTELYAATLKDEKSLKPLSDFMPGDWIHQPPEKALPTLEDTQAIFERMFS